MNGFTGRKKGLRLATLAKAVRRVKVYGASPELLLGILMFSMILLALAGVLEKFVTGSFFFNQDPQKNLILAQQLKDEGNRLLNQGKYVRAAEKLEEGLDLDGVDANNRFALASIYLHNGEVKKALDEFKECVKIAKHPGAYVYMSRLVRPYDPERSLKYLERAKEADPSSPSIDVEMGIAFRDAGKGSEAIAALERALEKEPAQSNYRQKLVAAIAELRSGGKSDKSVGAAISDIRAVAKALGEVRSPLR